MTIKEVLVHPWIEKCSKIQISEIRRKSSNNLTPDFKYYTSVTVDEVK
jgi:hypothetical protein